MSAQDVLVVADIQRGTLADVSLELLAAARGLASPAGGEVVALVLSPDGARYAPSLGAADRIVLMDDPQLAGYSPEPFLTALHEVVAAEGPRAVLIGATSIGWDLGPLLAARLGAPLVTGCKAVQSDGDALRVTTSFCGGKMLADVQVEAAPAVLVVLPGSFRPDAGTMLAWSAGKAVVEQRKPSAPLAAGAIAFDDWILPEAGDVDITQQDLLVAVGRGIQQKDNLELAEELAQALGGAVCAFAPGGGPGLAAPHAPGGQVGHDRQAQALSGPGHQRRPGAPGGHEGGGSDHCREHRSQGADLRHRPFWRRA